jgi:hypothetical protein
MNYKDHKDHKERVPGQFEVTTEYTEPKKDCVFSVISVVDFQTTRRQGTASLSCVPRAGW